MAPIFPALASAFRVGPRRPTVRDLHGPWDAAGPCWPEPYRAAVGSPAFAAAVEAPVRPGAVALWEHGRLLRAADEATRDALGRAWGRARVEGAALGPVEAPPLPDPDRALVAAFTARGWQRLLVDAFEHVPAKAAHLGLLHDGGLGALGELGAALVRGRCRHRLAVLEEALRAHDGEPHALFAALDGLDRALDARGGGRSWLLERVPPHTAALWPLRNVIRLAEREGVILRDVPYAEYVAEQSYAPDLPMMCLDDGIFGGGFHHDLVHYLLPVLAADDPVAFELGNEGMEAVGQAYNNLVLASWHTGPAYQGHGGWPGARLFELLERGFGLPSIPQQIAGLRALCLVLHPAFEGDLHATLDALVGPAGDREIRQRLVDFVGPYVASDKVFLEQIHPRYRTPVFAARRAAFGRRISGDVAETFRRADDLLHALQDVDLRRHDSPLPGALGALRERARHLGLKAIELGQLLREAGRPSPTLAAEAAAVLQAAVARDRDGDALMARLEAGLDGVPAPARDPARVAALEAAVDAYGGEVALLGERLARVARAIRAAQGGWPSPVLPVPEDFETSTRELFFGYFHAPVDDTGADAEGTAARL